MRTHLLALGLLAAGLPAGPAVAAPDFRNVTVPQLVFDPASGERAEVRFELTEPASVTLAIYDGRDLRVREIAPGAELDSGEHVLRWDGRDARGRVVPPEAYRFTLSARAASGAEARWDLTDVTGGDPVTVQELRWEPEHQEIRFLLPHSARVRIRAGLGGGGPLLRTVIDWVPRASGVHRQAWDGRDQSDVLDLGSHPDLHLAAEAFRLSRNTLMVGPPPDRVTWLDGLADAPRRARAASRRPRMFDYAEQALERRRDFPVRMEVRDGAAGSDGIVQTAGGVRIRIDVDPADRPRVLEERFEAVYFIDGQRWLEHEIGFLPSTWSIEPGVLPPGVHYLTTNLRGYNGHFGLATIQVRIGAPTSRLEE